MGENKQGEAAGNREDCFLTEFVDFFFKGGGRGGGRKRE